MVYVMGMKAALAFPDSSGPQRRKTPQALCGLSPLIPLYAAWKAHLGEAFMVKQKKNEKQWFRNVFPLLCCSFYFPTWMSRLFRSREGNVLPPPRVLHNLEIWASWSQTELCLHTHRPWMSLHVFGFHFEINCEALEVLERGWVVTSLKEF